MTITIETIDRYLRLSPHECLSKLASQLRYQRTFQVRDPYKGVRYEREQVDLHVFDDLENLMCPRGFLPRVERFLVDNGVPFVHSMVSDVILPEAKMDQLGSLREGQLEVLQSIANNHCGVVDALTGFGKGVLLEKVVRMYPDNVHAVFTKSKSVCNMLYKRLSVCLPSTGCWNSDIHKKGNPIICTIGSMTHLELDKIEIAQFDEVHELIIPSFLNHFPKFKGAKFIAYSATPDDRLDNSALAVEAYFGPKIAKVDYQDGVDMGLVVPIRVLRVRPKNDFDFPPSNLQNINSDVVKHRRGYWDNDARNNLIARTVTDMLPTFLKESDPQILILVDKVEHALRLASKLPDFKLAHGPISTDAKSKFRSQGILPSKVLSKKEVETLREDFNTGKERRVIATGIWSTGVDFPELSAIVRADGGASTIKDVQMPGRVCRLSEGKVEGILVDFVDEFDSWTARRSNSRLANYTNKKWSVSDVAI